MENIEVARQIRYYIQLSAYLMAVSTSRKFLRGPLGLRGIPLKPEAFQASGKKIHRQI